MFSQPNIQNPVVSKARKDLFATLWRASHWIWNRRNTAKQTKLPFSEETITETLLLELGTNHPREVQIVPFNKRQEGKIGADWEWCFYSRRKSQYFSMLIQAKLLDDKDESYSHIDRCIGNTGILQIDRFLSTAAKRNVPAIYVFYNHLEDVSRVPIDHCKSFSEPESWGCSIALASAVRMVLPSKKFDELKKYSKPLPCILCQGFSNRSGPEKALAALQELYRRSVALMDGKSAEQILKLPDAPFSEPPKYFEQLVSREIPLVEDLIAKVADENPGLDGIVLIGDR